MKKFRCIICIVSLALMLCLAFVSCSSDKYKYSDLFEALSQYYETTGENVSKISAQIVITLPAGCSAELLESANGLADTLSLRAYDEVKIKYDSDHKASSKEIEILIGGTDRGASKDLLKTMRINDYGYACDGGKIVIAGHTDLACAEAIKLFVSDVSSGTVRLSNVDAIEKRIIRDSYELEKIMICGFEASEYSIVYPHENKLLESALAEMLASGICDLGGYVLPVISDREMTASTRAICIGRISTSVQNATEEGRATVSIGNSGHVEILANDAYGLRLAAGELMNMIKENTAGENSKIDIDRAYAFEYGSSDLKIFSVNEAFGEGDLEKYSSTVNAIKTEAPTVALLYDCTDVAVDNLENNLGEVFSPGGRVFYVLADGTRVVDSDYASVGDGAVYKLTFETGSEDAPLRLTLIGVIAPSESGEELYSALNMICADVLGEPAVVLFDMSEALEEGFLEDGSMKKKGDGYFASSCDGAFLAKECRSTRICTDLTADVIETVIYFNK